MGDHFKVEVHDLESFQRTLKQAHDSLEEVRKRLSDVTAGGVGTKELDEACNDFQEHWSYGSEQISEQTKKLKEAVGKTAENYKEVETALQEAFAKAGSKAGGK